MVDHGCEGCRLTRRKGETAMTEHKPLHAWLIEYRDSTGTDKAANAHTRKAAEAMASQALRNGAQWATYRLNK